MVDYRLPENRREYFSALYRMNLDHAVMPGLVYLYLPALRKHYGWDDETTLWAAFINGLTQSPLTTLRILERLPACPPAGAELKSFTDWFNTEWANLHFDTDRLKNKRNTVEAIKSYAGAVAMFASQVDMLTNKSYAALWEIANLFHSMGRLSCFSYLEYVHLLGFGAECDNLMFEDKSGSRSHRNGMLFLLGHDNYVWDKRAGNGFDGNYDDFDKLVSYLDMESRVFLQVFNEDFPHAHANNFTLESQCCQFKNGFFARRYPGVYADMAWDRIKWYEERNTAWHLTSVFRSIRADNLPEWLREECEVKSINRKFKATRFKETGVPFRAEHFLEI
jgi:hypothetical protein